MKAIVWYLFLATCLIEFFVSLKPNEQVGTKTKQETPPADFDVRANRHFKTVTIEYCKTCSYNSLVQEIKTILEATKPHVQVLEYEHPPPYPLLIQLLSFLRLIGIVLLLGGDFVFSKLQMPYPSWYLYLKERKLMVGLFLFFGLNAITNWLSSTGAFEVYLNNRLVFSGLKEGRVPQVEEIIRLIK